MAIATLAGSKLRLQGGGGSYPDPSGVVSGMLLLVNIRAFPDSVDLLLADAVPTTLTPVAVGAAYDPGTGEQTTRCWYYKFTGAETFPLALTTVGGGFAIFDCEIISGQHATTPIDGPPVGAPKAFNSSPVVAASVTATNAGSRLVIAATMGDGAPYTPASTPPTTIILDGATVPGTWATTVYRDLASAGPSGTTSLPISGNSGAAAVSYVIAPAAAAASRRKIVSELLAA